MAKLTRKKQLVFASTAGANQVATIGSLAASVPARTTGALADPNTLQSLSNYLGGLSSIVLGGNSPAIEDLNGLFFLFAYQLTYLFQAGIPEWEINAIYFIGSIVNDGTNTLYVSLTNNNTGNALSSNSNWQVLGGNFSTKTSNYTATINDQFIRGDVTGGAFTVTLPAVASSKGMTLKVKNVAASGGLNLTLKGNASETIDGSNTQILTNLDSMTVFCNGSTWDII